MARGRGILGASINTGAHGLCLLFVALLLLSACAGPNTPVTARGARAERGTARGPAPFTPPESGRLPADVRPLRYRLDLSLDPASPGYQGNVEIDLELDRPSNLIWLNAQGLSLSFPHVRLDDGTRVAAAHTDGIGHNYTVLWLPRPVGPGQITLRTHFYGHTSLPCKGIFSHQHEGASYLFSQLEATHARRAFPSFDEPGFKTPFDVSITTPSGNVALSNEREVRTIALNGRTKTIFATTPPLPTYALAFAAGPFDLFEAPTVPPNALRQRPLRLRGAAYRGEGGRLRWALGQVPPLLDDLERYVDAEYPFTKLDFIASPCEHPLAMENPGAVMVNEKLLLHDDGSTEADRRAAAHTIAHELSHMWFGNSVTPRWWSDLWLSESFAEWLGAATVSRTRPDDRADLVLVSNARGAMADDLMPTARPIRHPMRGTDEIRDSFNDLTYRKGAAVLGMVEHAAGPDKFQRALRAYLARRRGGSAEGDDLLNSLAAEAGPEAADTLRDFLAQPGVPYVEARLDCGQGTPLLRLRQSRYRPLGGKATPSHLWHLPVCARYAGGARERCMVLREPEGALELPASSCPAWVMPNAGGVGYYRWQLPSADLRRLAAALPSLDAKERLSFADALLSGWRNATLDPADAFELLTVLAKDPEPQIATALTGPLWQARSWFAQDAALVRNVERLARDVYSAPFGALGPEPKGGAEPPERAQLRRDLRPFLALTGQDPGVRAALAALGRAHLENKDKGPKPDGLALRMAIDEAGAPLFDAALERLEKAALSDRWRYVYALASVDRPELLARARALAFDKRIYHGEVLSVLNGLSWGVGGRDDTWAWVVANLSALRARALSEHFSQFLRIAAGLCDARHATELTTRFAEFSADARVVTEVEAAAEHIRRCAAQRGAQRAKLGEFFGRTQP